MRSALSLLVLLAVAGSALVSKAMAVAPADAPRGGIVACCGPVDKPIDPD